MTDATTRVGRSCKRSVKRSRTASHPAAFFRTSPIRTATRSPPLTPGRHAKPFGRALALAVLLGVCGGVAHAQASASIVGSVTAQGGTPLSDAEVIVEGTLWTAHTDAHGRFQIKLPPGRWRVSSRHLGFVPAFANVEIDAARSPADTIRFVLERAPVELRGITTTAAASASTSSLAVTATRDNVRNVPPLGEPDLLRLLPFLPGIQQPDDMRGALYLGGSAADETAMFLDSYPMQWPMHINGIFGAFNVAALDRVDVRLHRLPIQREGPLGGSIEITPRQVDTAMTDAGLSLLSGTATIARPRAAGSMDLLASARATYADLVAQRIYGGRDGRGDALPVPAFRDALLRLSSTSGRVRWSALGFMSRDQSHRTTGSGQPLGWGESLLGLQVAAPIGGWRGSARLSRDVARVWFRSSENDNERIDVRQPWTHGGVDVTRTWQKLAFTTGADMEVRGYADAWNSSQALAAFSLRVPQVFQSDRDQRLASAYAETMVLLRDGWQTSLGSRAQLTGAQVLAPRWSIDGDLRSNVHLGLSLERRAQFDVQLSSFANGGVAQPTYPLDRPRTSDGAAAELRWQVARARDDRSLTELRFVPFRRWYHGRPILMPDTTPARAFPFFERADARSYGASIALDRRTAGGLVLQGSYTYQRAVELLDGMSSPAEWDSPHALTGFASVPLGRRWMLNVAGQARSGVPTTPVGARIFVPLASGYYGNRYVPGERNSGRLSSYDRLDLGVARSWHALGASWTFNAQVLNVLARENALEYNWALYFGEHNAGESAASRRALPIIPSFGLAATW